MTETPLDICLLSPGLAHHGGTLSEKSLGGSETAAIHIAKSLVARGHFVTVFSPGHTGGQYDGVTYLPIEQFVPYASNTAHDVTIISRDVNFLPVPFPSKMVVFWCHDLALKRNLGGLAPGLWNVQRIYLMSQWQRQQYESVFNTIPPECFHVTRNGVDLPALQAVVKTAGPRDPKRFVYGSRPERGLDTALNVMAELARRQSSAYLEVAWYDNMPPHMEPYYRELWARAQTMPNVRLLGPLKQADWHARLATARAVLYPGAIGQNAAFREISMIIALEALAVGTPVIAVAKGAVPETLAGIGRLIGDETTDCSSLAHVQAMATAVEELMVNHFEWQGLHRNALERGQTVGWDAVAAEWEADWLRFLAERHSNPWRVERHLRRIGDLDALP